MPAWRIELPGRWGSLSLVSRRPPGFSIAPDVLQSQELLEIVVVKKNIRADYEIESFRLRELEALENNVEIHRLASQHDVRPYSHRSRFEAFEISPARGIGATAVPSPITQRRASS